MNTKYNIEIDNSLILEDLTRITNQIFKLLPCREEGGDWESPLINLIYEVIGMNNLFYDQINFLILLTKMESLLTLTKEEDFFQFRKIIFECLRLMNELKCLD